MHQSDCLVQPHHNKPKPTSRARTEFEGHALPNFRTTERTALKAPTSLLWSSRPHFVLAPVLQGAALPIASLQGC
jgi:hypothetical protein